MPNQKKIKNQAKEVKKYIKQHNLRFIRNNERYREKLGMNQRQLYYIFHYLSETGYLEPWNKKIYQIRNI